jgi:glycosyltransferase involved in cell wall biosynthesis
MTAPLDSASRADGLVSVITIFLDEERFLAEAVESVRAQSRSDWELILVDDGSTDRSSDMARAYAAQDRERIRYVAHPGGANRGMSASRNLGLSAARGEFVGFLDADDAWLPTKLEEQCAILEAHPQCGLTYGRTLIWRSWDVSGADFLYPLGVAENAVHAPPRLFDLLIENRAQSPTTCNALMRRALIEGVGGFEESFRGMFEDQAFFAKALLAAPAYVDGRVWAKYRQHAQSCSALSEREGCDLAARRRLLLWVRAHLRRELAPYPSARARLSRELRWNRLRQMRQAAKRMIVRARA